jgi:UDP-hydrolysing UDP-N-acetyl-D-glucosamine 2-epimerase
MFLVTFHPPTLSDDASAQCQSLLAALDQFPQASVIVTGSNADPGAREIDALMQAWVIRRTHAVFVTSLGSQRYVSALAEADVVIGNSSSGLYEAPSFGLPTVNVGDRQARRPRADTVIDCPAETGAIAQAIAIALARGRQAGGANPYGDGNAAPRIADIIAGLDEPALLIRKSFRDMDT